MDSRANSEITRWIVGPADADLSSRLDRFVATQAGVSRGQVRHWLESGCITLDGRVARRGGELLRAGQAVVWTPPTRDWVGSGTGGCEVLAQGADWFAVNKPAGVPVHPLRPDESGTLLGTVAGKFPRVLGVGDEGELRSGVVHRLDVDTSGVMLFALSDARWRALREAFSRHRVRKTYVALVDGVLEAEGEAEQYLAVTRHSPARVEVVDPVTPSARKCSLGWRVLAVGERCSRVEIDLRTGFLHQVRVMFAAMGHPLLGDRTYASPPIADRAPRQMLHAKKIEFDELSAEAERPEDFVSTAEREGVV
ncbi:MAG: RluA family pseudouridine synthase [Planctomycetota bacterium]